MTKEQEEAIEILSDSNILFNIQRDTALSIRVAIETVLNMLIEKDKKLEKKDKQIELTIDFIYKLAQKQPGTVIHYLEKDGFNTSRCNNCSLNNDCRKCFKQYFERKVKDEL